MKIIMYFFTLIAFLILDFDQTIAKDFKFNKESWQTIGRGSVEWKGKSVTIKDCFISLKDAPLNNYELSFKARASEESEQVQIWSGFGFQNRDNRYSLGLRGGNNNDLYLCRYQSNAKSEMLAIESLDFKPTVGEWYRIRVVFIEGNIRIFLNDEEIPRMVLYDKEFLNGGSPVIGGGWIKTDYTDFNVEELSEDETNKYLNEKIKFSTLLPADEKEEMREGQRRDYEGIVIENFNDARTEISLEGDWLFMPEYQMDSEQIPYSKDLDDNNWHVMQVPAFWNPVRNWLHLQESILPHPGSGISDNYREAEYTRCNNYTFDFQRTTAAWYRHQIVMPENMVGKKFRLYFEAVSKVADVYVNGEYVGGHIGMFGDFELDITDQLKSGKNIIAVNIKVRKYEKRADADKNVARAVSVDINNDMLNSLPSGMFGGNEGGIWQPVKLRITQPIHIEDLFANVRTDGGAFEIELKNSGTENENVEVKIEIIDQQDNSRLYLSPNSEKAFIKTGESAKLICETGKINPKLWSPENPNRYLLISSVYKNGKLIDQISTGIGFRTFEAIGNKFFLNGKPYYLRGANHPPCGIRPNDSKLANKFYGFMHEGNTNITRSHGCPFTSAWMDASDKQGVGVSYEGSWPWMMISNVASKELRDIWKAEMLSLVRKYRNHPSLLIWTVNNEMYFPMFKHNDSPEIRLQKMTFLSDVIKEIRKLSPKIPISGDSGYSRVKADYEKNLKPHGIDDGDIDDRHVYLNWYNRDFYQVYYGEWAKRIYWSPGANPDRPFFSQEASTGYTNNDEGHYNRKYLFQNYAPQSWIGDWAYEDKDPAFTLNRHAFMTKELMEVIRRTSPETAGVQLFANVTWYRNVFDAESIEPYPIYHAVKKADNPVLVSAELFGRNFYAGSKITPRICIVNNSMDGKDIPSSIVEWSIIHEGIILASGEEIAESVPFYERVWIDADILLPDNLPVDKAYCQLELKLKTSDTIISENQYDLIIANKNWIMARKFQDDKVIGVFDLTGETFKVLDFMDIKYFEIKDLTEIRTKKMDLLIVANLDVDEEIPYNWEDVRTVANNGLNVILIHPGKHLQWLLYDKIESVYERKGRVVNMHIPEHQAFNGIEPLELAWWQQRGNDRPRACKRSFRFKNKIDIASLAIYLRPHTGLGGNREETYFEMSGTPLLKIKEKDGTIIASEMELNMGVKDPIAAKLFLNIIYDLLKL